MLLGMVPWKGKWRILPDEDQQSEGLKFLKGVEGTGSWPGMGTLLLGRS